MPVFPDHAHWCLDANPLSNWPKGVNKHLSEALVRPPTSRRSRGGAPAHGMLGARLTFGGGRAPQEAGVSEHVFV